MKKDHKKKHKIGIVVSDRMNKTIVVRVRRITKHHKYRRLLRVFSNVKAHDEKNTAGIGDQVKILPCRPLSKDKRFRLIEITKKAS